MTTAPLATVDWIRFAPNGADCFTPFTLTPSDGIELRLNVGPAPQREEYADLLAPPRLPETRVSVDLVPAKRCHVEECEAKARRAARALGAEASPLASLSEFSLEAALAGEGLPYSRAQVPRLTLLPFGLPEVDVDEEERGLFVRVFTATARAASDGAYVLRRTA